MKIVSDFDKQCALVIDRIKKEIHTLQNHEDADFLVNLESVDHTDFNLPKDDFREGMVKILFHLKNAGLVNKFKHQTEMQVNGSPDRFGNLTTSEEPQEVYLVAVPIDFTDRVSDYLLGVGSRESVSTKSLSAVFDDNSRKISVGNVFVRLPYAQNEHYLTRVMFSQEFGTLISWEDIYDAMAGVETDRPKKKKKKSVYDTVGTINKKFSKQDLPPLFKWENKSVERLY